jgi:hypothetical protein
MTCKSWNINQFFLLSFFSFFFYTQHSFYSMSSYTCKKITFRRLSYYADFVSSLNPCLVTKSNTIPDYTNCNASQSNWVSTIKVIIKLSQKMLYGRTFQTFWCVIFCRLYVLYGFAILWKLTCFSPLSLIYKRSRKWVTNETPLT